MISGDIGKLIILAGIVAGIFVLLATHAMSSDVGAPMLTAVLGYLFGNGQAAIQKPPPPPP